VKRLVYNLNCFRCGRKFQNKKQVFRIKDKNSFWYNKPVCAECEGNYYQDKAAMEAYNDGFKPYFDEYGRLIE